MEYKFDVINRIISPSKVPLTPKQFNLMLFLGIRRTDGSDGWVSREEIGQRVLAWNQRIDSIGKEISRYTEYKWFEGYVEYDKITKGPYRLRPTDIEFLPDRDAAIERIIDPRPERRSKNRPAKSRSLDRMELQAYDLIVQYGFFIPAVTDLIRQRIGNPASLRNPDERLVAYRILATFHKNRAKTREARDLALKGLKLAKKLKYKDDIAYLLDQIGGSLYIERNYPEARAYFEKEIEFLNEWGSRRAEFHLVGAYRGLAATLRWMGELPRAEEAINKSKYFAERSGNEEGLRIAAIEETRIKDKDSVVAVTELLASQPSEHIVARVMMLSTAAEKLLQKNLRQEGETLLKLALLEAKRLQFRNQIDNIKMIAEKYGMKDFIASNSEFL
jgi:tetratricopeptide (TPR) repeat protein